MLKREPFKYSRQLFPVKDLQKSVDKLGFDKNVRKIKIINLIKSIFYNIVIYDNTSSDTLQRQEIQKVDSILAN